MKSPFINKDGDITTIESLFNVIYPVGSIYQSTDSTSPATLFGGTWAAFGAGRVLVGIDPSQAVFDSVKETGGENNHTLTTNEMPNHNHRLHNAAGISGILDSGYAIQYTATNRYDVSESEVPSSGEFTGWGIGYTGDGYAHNNLQPYIVVYMWERTA